MAEFCRRSLALSIHQQPPLISRPSAVAGWCYRPLLASGAAAKARLATIYKLAPTSHDPSRNGEGGLLMDESTTDAFSLASRFLVQAVRLVPETAWDAPGLGSWNMLELVGHANRAHTTVEEYLLHPRPPEQQGSNYFSDAAVAERGRDAVAALGEHPAVTIAAKSDKIIALSRGLHRRPRSEVRQER